MKTLAFVVIAAAFGADPSVPVATPPQIAPPQFGVAVLNDKGEIEVRYTESVAVWKPHGSTKTFTVRDGGQLKSVTETTAYQIRLHETKAATESRAAGHYRVFRNGAELDEKTRTELLKQPRRVVFLESQQFRVVDRPNEFYMDLLADDTLVVLLDILQTPEVKVEPEKQQPTPADDPSLRPYQKQIGPDGRYWTEHLCLLPDDEVGGGQTSNGLRPMFDPDMNGLYVRWRKRPDVAPRGWGGPQLLGQDSELTWFGHRTGDGPREALRISFGTSSFGGTRVPHYLSVVNARTKPELTFTKLRDGASLWSLIAEKAWIDKSRDTSDESDAENMIGYIRLESVPDVELWLSLSPQPILQTRPTGLRVERTETVECRVLTISPKKEYRFHYERQWIGGK